MTGQSQKEFSDGRPSKGVDESEKGQESASEDEENAVPKRSVCIFSLPFSIWIFFKGIIDNSAKEHHGFLGRPERRRVISL